MIKSNYIAIQPPVEVSIRPISNPVKHLEISPRGVIATSSEMFDIGTTVSVSLKLVSMTGSLDFTGKVFECNSLGESAYEVYIKFYGMSHEKENEVYSFIQENS